MDGRARTGRGGGGTLCSAHDAGDEASVRRCQAMTAKGERCRNRVLRQATAGEAATGVLCNVHAGRPGAGRGRRVGWCGEDNGVVVVALYGGTGEISMGAGTADWIKISDFLRKSDIFLCPRRGQRLIVGR